MQRKALVAAYPAASRNVLAAVLVAAIAASPTACGASEPVPRAVSLSELAQNQDTYLATEVRPSGVVRREHDLQGRAYYVLADARANLVVLKPPAAAKRYIGRRVMVTGRFDLDPNEGRVIRTRTIGPGRSSPG